MRKNDRYGFGLGLFLVFASIVICIISIGNLESSCSSLALILPGLAIGGVGVVIIDMNKESQSSKRGREERHLVRADFPKTRACALENPDSDCRDFVHNNVAWNNVVAWKKKTERLTRNRWPRRYP